MAAGREDFSQEGLLGGKSIPPGTWSTGLCGCFEDIEVCFCTCCCWSVTVGQVAEIASDGQIGCLTAGLATNLIELVAPLSCLYAAMFRQRLRERYSLPAEPCGDCCLHFFCNQCALCQEMRELKYRGWDPTISHSANVQIRHVRQLQSPPAQQMKF